VCEHIQTKETSVKDCVLFLIVYSIEIAIANKGMIKTFMFITLWVMLHTNEHRQTNTHIPPSFNGCKKSNMWSFQTIIWLMQNSSLN